MPINILSLPIKDLQYALECMDIGDLVAFSLCSKRTKNLVESSNRKLYRFSIFVYENHIRFEMDGVFLDIFDSYTIRLGDRTQVWRRQELTQNDWIAHVMSIFNDSVITFLSIENDSLSYLDTIKQFFPKCRTLHISENCSREFAKIAFWKLYSIAEDVEVGKNIFENENDISKVLTLNLEYVNFEDWENPFNLALEDLLTINITDLTLGVANISEKELNRFLKLWMKRSHTFYRPKVIRLHINGNGEVICEEILKGINYETVDDEYRLKRSDGKELIVYEILRRILCENRK